MASYQDFQKVTQAMTYIANRYTGKRLSRILLMKLLWAADRYHVRKYGRLITNPDYVAMKHGPAHSTAKRIADEVEFPEPYDSYAKSHIRKEAEYFAKAVGEVDIKKLSQTDIEALEFALKHFGTMDKWKLRDLTHIYPEWAKHEELAKVTSVAIDPLDFFENPAMKNDPFALDADHLEAAKERFTRSQNIAKVLQ
jgi:uncharacterized phage-associated protein